MWEFGDQGSIIVIVNGRDNTNIVYYTLDEGDTWNEYKFSEEMMHIEDIATVPSDSSRKFCSSVDHLSVVARLPSLSNLTLPICLAVSVFSTNRTLKMTISNFGLQTTHSSTTTACLAMKVSTTAKSRAKSVILVDPYLNRTELFATVRVADRIMSVIITMKRPTMVAAN